MNQSRFEHIYRPHWEQFSRVLEALEGGSVETPGTISIEDFPRSYRQLCNHYALARARHYSPALVDHLHGLVLRGHRQLYKKKTQLIWTIIGFITYDFPSTLRQNLPAFWLALALFALPCVTIAVATYRSPTRIYSLMNESGVARMETMYTPKTWKIGRTGKQKSETDVQMFGFYIFNNISIGFRTFAGGVVFGIGSIFFLIFNGLLIGGAAGYLSHPPYRHVFWQFVLGHGALELTAIVISGAAGLLLGYSLIRPGRYRRLDALRLQAPIALKLAMGAAAMLLGAAFIEAFWSSMNLPQATKYTFAACAWTLVILYFCFAGRDQR